MHLLYLSGNSGMTFFEMSLPKIIRIVTIVLIFSIYLGSCFSYTVETLSDDDVCSHTKKRRLSVKTDRNSAKIIKETRSFDGWPGHKEFQCKYEVRSPSGDGVIAVIQNLSFRPDENGGCLDYVKFKTKDGVESDKFCGHVSAFKRSSGESDFYSFVDAKGELDTTIYVANRKLTPYENLDLEIVYTSYRDCSHGRKTYSPCGPFARDICIWDELFDDNIVNCPVDCFDETSCVKNDGDVVSSSNVGTKVTVGAITTIILAFILFITCLWIMRRNRKLCWSNDCSGPRPTPPPTRVEMHPHLHEEDSRSMPAPSVPTSQERASVTISEDKDLPPSYESLFPAR